MIILDTNVVSEVMRKDPDPRVFNWLHHQRTPDLHLAAPALAELLVGIAVLPAGKRTADLSQRLWQLINRRLTGRILSFDRLAAETFAQLLAAARTAGQAVSALDGQIAAIAANYGFTVATRDVRPFQACGVPVINPWELPAPTS